MQVLSDPLREILKVAERVSVARDKFALAVIDISEGTEAVDLQLEDVLVGVERLKAERVGVGVGFEAALRRG